MNECIESEAVAPTVCEVLNFEIFEVFRRISTPTQQRALQVRLLQIRHDVTQYRLHLKEKKIWRILNESDRYIYYYLVQYSHV